MGYTFVPETGEFKISNLNNNAGQAATADIKGMKMPQVIQRMQKISNFYDILYGSGYEFKAGNPLYEARKEIVHTLEGLAQAAGDNWEDDPQYASMIYLYGSGEGVRGIYIANLMTKARAAGVFHKDDEQMLKILDNERISRQSSNGWFDDFMHSSDTQNFLRNVQIAVIAVGAAYIGAAVVAGAGASAGAGAGAAAAAGTESATALTSTSGLLGAQGLTVTPFAGAAAASTGTTAAVSSGGLLATLGGVLESEGGKALAAAGVLASDQVKSAVENVFNPKDPKDQPAQSEEQISTNKTGLAVGAVLAAAASALYFLI